MKGEHASACTGMVGDRQCAGCLPRPAEHGMLCWSCWERFLKAAQTWSKFQVLFLNVERAVQNDNAGVRSQISNQIPLTSLRLDMDVIRQAEPAFGQTPEQVVSTPFGAYDAIMFTRAVEHAERKHPTEEKPHRLNRQRCTECSQLSLVRYPPTSFGDDVKVVCITDTCGHVMDPRSFETLAMIEGKK